MSKKTFLTILAIIGGEVLIICTFMLFQNYFVIEGAFVLSTIVCSIMYLTLFINAFKPLVNLKEKSPTEVGTLGPQWFFSFGYVILGGAAIYLCNFHYFIPLNFQMLIHGALVLGLTWGFISVFTIGDKVAKVAKDEKILVDGVVKMKKVLEHLSDDLCEKTDIPSNIIEQINDMTTSVNLLSPINNPEAHSLEDEFVATIEGLQRNVSNYSLNQERIDVLLKRSERILQKRKEIYSI